MNLKFKNIKLHNFMSYQDAEVSLNRHGYILVSGVNNNPIDNAKSNGTGKSSLFSAISWALTGLTVSGGKEVANIYLDGTTSVELDFTVDNIPYKVVRTKNPSNLKIFVQGEDKSGKGIRDTEKILSEYLPDITYTLLGSVIILSQGLPQRFSNNSPSGRKEILEKLSNSDFMISDLKRRVANRGTYLKERLRELENTITDLTARLDVSTLQLTNAECELSKLDDDSYANLVSSIAEEQAFIDDCKIAVTNYQVQIEEKESILNGFVDQIAVTSKKHLEERNNLELLDVTDISDKIVQTLAEKTQLSKEIVQLDSVTDVCPTCGQKLPNIHKIDTTDKKLALQALQDKLKEYTYQKQEIEVTNAEVIKAFEDEFAHNQEQLNAEYTEVKSHLSMLRSMCSSKEDELKSSELRLRTKQLELDNFETAKSSLKDNISLLKLKINDYKDKIVCYNKDVDILSKHIEINNKMSTILSRDFRGYLLENVITFISNQAKQYAQDIFDNDKLEFLLDGNNISIMYDSKDYEVLSGGEKQKIDVIIQLAIRDMLCSFLNFSSNILVLDEITDNLDIIGCQKMFNLISNKLNDVEAVYLISHHQDDFEIPYDDEITIIKEADRISRIYAA